MTFADRLLSALSPVALGSADLDTYARGIADKMVQEVEDYASDGINGEVGWSAIVDLNRVPDKGLDWLAQFVGVTLNAGLTAAQKRQQIHAVGGWGRGSLASIAGAPVPYLTGTKTVIIRERDPAACAAQPAYGLTVITKTSETPNSAVVLAALIAQKPAGIVLNYVVLAGNDYTLVYNGGATTYANVFSTYTTYQGLLNGVPGT